MAATDMPGWPLHVRDPESNRRTQLSAVDISRAYFNASTNGIDPTFVMLPAEHPGCQQDVCGLLKKKVWNQIEDMACGRCEIPVGGLRNPTKAAIREMQTVPRVAAETTTFLAQICGRSFVLDPTTGTPVPSPLAEKILKRGIVPLLVKIVRSNGERETRMSALSGIGQISCAKDCRTLLLQHPDG